MAIYNYIIIIKDYIVSKWNKEELRENINNIK